MRGRLLVLSSVQLHSFSSVISFFKMKFCLKLYIYKKNTVATEEGACNLSIKKIFRPQRSREPIPLKNI